MEKVIPIKGNLSNSADGSAIPYAVIQIIESEQWTTTDEEGHFILKDNTLSTFTLEVKCIGKQNFRKTYQIQDFTQGEIKITLADESFAMEEVIVTAEKGQGMTTTSTINSAAIEHVQPTTLGDVMQLLPGNIIVNPDLSKKQSISIRETSTSANSASGTAIIVDGAPINNDGNFQTYSTNNLASDGASVTQSTGASLNSSIGGGVDLRQISTDNIESVEVIKGIPSVTYGDLTSGAVIVKTKSGHTPYEVKIKSDPNLKQVYVGKGIKFHQGGSANANIDYTNSYKDLRSKYTAYDRVTAQLAYSKTFLKDKSPLSFNSKLSFFQSIDKEKTDPDALVLGEAIESSETGARLSMYGKWSLNNRWITNVNYTFSANGTQQEDYLKKYRSTGVQKISLSKEAGENEGIYLPSESLTELTIKGLPVSLFGQISATKNHNFTNGIINNILAGAEYRLTGNNGEGRIYDISNPPTVNERSSRPRSFKDIPAATSFTVFLENKLTLPLATTALDIQTGLRVNNFQPTGWTSSDMGIYLEPRLNARYKIIDKPKNTVKEISLHGGVGLNYKTPSLLYLYPDMAYIDLVSLDHYTEDPNTAMAYFTTTIFNPSNPQLNPSKNFKQEVGVDFKIGEVRGNITGFKETLSDGFGLLNHYLFVDYQSYDGKDVPEGTLPDITTLPASTATYITYYSQPVNNKETEKLGVEYDFSFGKIKALSTEIMMNGAWLKTTQNYSTIPTFFLPTKTSSGQYEHIAVYPAGEGAKAERLNTTFRFVTHSSRLRLVFTTTMQVTWIDKVQQTDYDDVPMYLYNRAGDITPFTTEMRNNSGYEEYVKVKKVNYFMEESLPPLLLCNFKLSKEFSDKIKLSFYANNFLNQRPTYQSKRTYNYTKRNPEIYFGAELNIKL